MAERMQVLIEDAHIFWPNFTGREGPYNKEGDRNFCVSLDPEVATKMTEDGWNVKWPKETDDEEEAEATKRLPYIQVGVKYKVMPPKIVLRTSTARTPVTESIVETLDGIDIKTADLIINASHWNVNGKFGIKAYLKSLHITVDEDPLDLKYARLDQELDKKTNGA